jgi:hypothetical protein
VAATVGVPIDRGGIQDSIIRHQGVEWANCILTPSFRCTAQSPWSRRLDERQEGDPVLLKDFRRIWKSRRPFQRLAS